MCMFSVNVSSWMTSLGIIEEKGNKNRQSGDKGCTV